MLVALAILLLMLFAIAFWIVKESKVKTWMKLTLITLFFSFCVILATSLDSATGWASTRYIPETVTIRFVVVKEPNPALNFEGKIYFLLDVPPTKYDSVLLMMFGYKTQRVEPRLFQVPYSRSLHESLQKNVFPKLMKGQLVQGKLMKGKQGSGDGEGFEGDGQEGNGKGKGKGRPGGKGRGGKGGGGSDSQEPNDMMFYELPPSYFQQKQEPDSNQTP